MRAAFVVVIVAAVVVASPFARASPCSDAKQLTNQFFCEKGPFVLQWEVQEPTITIQVTLPGSAWVGVGFGGSMTNTDMVLSWVDSNGTAVSTDRYSQGHAPPNLDTELGGTDDVKVVCGQRENNATTVRFVRKLVTGDKYDAAINTSAVVDMVYAWANGSPGSLNFHGDNHNHVRVDLNQPGGTPNSVFGREESGLASRLLIQNSTFGTLITLQSEQRAGGPGMQGYPFGEVADIADPTPSTGMPLLLLSQLERNIINWNANSMASLAVQSSQGYLGSADPMTAPRTTLMGTLQLVPESGIPAARQNYLAVHPEAKYWIDFPDFALYTFNVSDVYWVGGFGNMHYIGWVSADQYLSHSL